MDSLDRRGFLKTAGGVTLGLMTVSGLSLLGACTATEKAEETQTTSTQVDPLALPWPYKKIDPVAAAERAYAAYSNGGCMYGAFEGIIGELRSLVGEPYTGFPAAMMKYGAAGVVGWGTLCGCLNGGAAAVYVVRNAADAKPIIDEMYAWYGASILPDYKPATPKFSTITTSIANSQLCHVSVTRWSEVSGFKTGSPERAERCAWLTASVAKYTAEILNKQADGTFAVVNKVPAEVASCIGCHGKGGIVENVHQSSGSSCVTCHDDLSAAHPAK